MIIEHSFDLPKLLILESQEKYKENTNMLQTIKCKDEYAQFKMINYIRTCQIKCQCFSCLDSFNSLDKLLDHYKNSGHVLEMAGKDWNDSRFMFPCVDNDPLLTLDFDVEL
jgi:hypothetical protein